MTRLHSPSCHSVSIKWQLLSTDAPEPLQAPAHVQSLFHNDRLLVYGFVPHCTQATLCALIQEKEFSTIVSTTELQKTTGTMIHKLTAQGLIRDYEDGILHENETNHEMKKQILKSLIIKLSKENSLITQFTSFVAVEKRDGKESPFLDIPNISELIAKEDIDFLPYIGWQEEQLEDSVAQPFSAFFEWKEKLPQPHLTNRKFKLSRLEYSEDLDVLEDFGSQLSEKPLIVNFEHGDVEKPLDTRISESFKLPLCEAAPFLKPAGYSISAAHSSACLEVQPFFDLSARISSPSSYECFFATENNETPEFLTSSCFQKAAKFDIRGSNFTASFQSQKDEQSWMNFVPWTELFSLQTEDGFWKLTPELGFILNLNINILNSFLEQKGIRSLGIKGRERLLDLIATFLVLQFLRTTLEHKGIVFKSLMKLDDASISRTIPWAFEEIKKASEWVRRTEGQYPSICQRLELGQDWDSATKQLLGHHFSLQTS